MPVAMSSKVSCSSVATALPGAIETTVEMWRLTSWFKSSLREVSLTSAPRPAMQAKKAMDANRDKEEIDVHLDPELFAVEQGQYEDV